MLRKESGMRRDIMLVAATLSVSMTASLLASSARAEEELTEEEWLEQAEDEPPPRYGPGGTREPSPTSRVNPMLPIGISVTAVGGMGIVAGALLAMPCAIPDPSADCASELAGGLAVGGALGVLIGIPVLVAGARNRHGTGPSLRFYAAPLPRGGGLGVTAAF
jgi:hypothetical protein